MRQKSHLLFALGSVLSFAVVARMDWVMNQYVASIEYVSQYSDYSRWRALAWLFGLAFAITTAVLTALGGRSEFRSESENQVSTRSAILIAMSIAVQQAIIFLSQSTEIMLMHVSAWVETAPIRLVWCMWFLVPLLFVRPLTASRVCRSYALSGWIFVFAAVGWSQLYYHFCEKDGVPVSWSEVKDAYYRGMQDRQSEQLDK